MIDREARIKLCDAIEAYCGEAITAFEFDDLIFDIEGHTEDETAKQVVQWLWHHYDDIEDHKIVLTKEEWDYFQRLRLLLESDTELSITRKWCWNFRQLIAAISLALFVYLACVTGFDLHLYLLAIPFGLVSIAISDMWWVHEPAEDVDPKLVPFPTHTALSRVRRQVNWFKKRRYPKFLTDRRIRGDSAESIMWFQTIVGWLLFAPLALLGQSFPRQAVDIQLLTPSAAATS